MKNQVINDVNEEDEFVNRLLNLPEHEFEAAILTIQEIMMEDLIAEKQQQGKIVFYGYDHAMLN